MSNIIICGNNYLNEALAQTSGELTDSSPFEEYRKSNDKIYLNEIDLIKCILKKKVTQKA